ncbi:unnamed protein product [Strongylus vulgaris]|uniref:Uncharacterized protein n=1 Tax=Strongylus vulgaris TaxID=40348 RepID=A0A3P7IKX2_STRVU|nr:unnamed protein product [Strongylus vulgaris]
MYPGLRLLQGNCMVADAHWGLEKGVKIGVDGDCRSFVREVRKISTGSADTPFWSDINISCATESLDAIRSWGWNLA